MAENKSGIYWADMVMEPALSDSEKKLRDDFVKQYLVDYDAYRAAIRVGFLPTVAINYVQMLLQDPYVLRQIKTHEEQEAEDPKAEESRNRRRVETALIREAHYKGPGSSHAARVSALAKLGSIYGMDAVSKTKLEITTRGGVMVVPAIASIDDWEKAALESQEDLVRDSQEA